MEIKNVIVHKLNKELKEKGVEQQPVTFDPRESELDKDSELVNLLIEKISESFKRGKTFGSFDSNKTIHQFQTWLSDMYDEKSKTSFIDLTITTMESLKTEIAGQNFATGGHIIFCNYLDSGNQWFMIVMLKDKDGFSFENLQLEKIQELDIDRLHQLARINVTAWQAGDTKAYLSFINKKKGDASGYFVKVIGCTDSVPSKVATRAVFNIVDAIFEMAEIKGDVTKKVKETVYEFMDARRPNPVSLLELSAIINYELPLEFHEAFIDLANSDEYQISEEFEPNLSELKKYKRIKHTTSLWTLDVERNAIGKPNSGADVIYNEDDNSLTFIDLPSKLAEEIIASFTTDEENNE